MNGRTLLARGATAADVKSGRATRRKESAEVSFIIVASGDIQVKRSRPDASFEDLKRTSGGGILDEKLKLK